MPIWKSTSRRRGMPWGEELRWTSPWGVHGKFIRIHAGERTSLKYYPQKSEVLYCILGKAIVYAPKEHEFGDHLTEKGGSEFYVKPGDVLYIQPENPYRIKACEDCVFIEVTSGTPGRDAVRLEDDYGRLDYLCTEPSRGKK